MPRKKKLQTNFSAGELSPEVSMRLDTDQYQNGAKSLLNRRMLVGGGHTRRPGSWRKQVLAGDAVIAEFRRNRDTEYALCFGSGRMDAFLPSGAASGSITGAPWTGTIWSDMAWAPSGNSVILTQQAMPPQIVTRTGVSSWSRTAFTFDTGIGGKLSQPYYKVADRAITLAPSGLTGSVTLTASAAAFQAGHVGQRVRYIERELQITAFTNSTTVTATVIEALPPTQRLTVASTAGIALHEVVQGDTSTAKGEVVAVVDGTHIDVVIIEKLTKFQNEDLVTPNVKVAISAVADATPAAVTDWDEALFTAYNGYPDCVEIHRGRVCFAGHPIVPNALIASSIFNIYSFDLGDQSDGDAIFETIGDSGASRIAQLHSAEHLLVLTDNGPYYIPESPANPFKPTGIQFSHFGSSWPISRARAQAFDDGVIFTSGSLVIKARPTGNQVAAWSADEVSLLSHHLVKTPTNLSACANFAGDPERYAFIRNADGTLAVMQLVEAQKIRNFTPWQTDGDYRSTGSLSGTVYAVVRRTINGNTVYWLEIFDQGTTLDGATEYADLDDLTALYGSTTVNVVVDNYHLGTFPLAIEDPPAGPYTVGLFYDSWTETLPPAISDESGDRSGDNMRIIAGNLHVLASSRFKANNYEIQAYQVTDDMSLPPPLRSGPIKFGFLGWRKQPTVKITQPDPLPLKILGINLEVAF